MSLDLIKKVKPKLYKILANFCFDTWSHIVEKPHASSHLNQWQGVMFGARGGGGGHLIQSLYLSGLKGC